jgi:hypothetical protein
MRIPLTTAILAAALVLGGVAVVLAAHPVEGAKYKGKIKNDPVNTKISFEVSGNGEKVRDLKTKLDPIFNDAVCGGVTPSVTQGSNPANISRKGKFRGKIIYTYPDSGTFAQAIVKGKFRRHGRATGKVTASFPNTDCDGEARFSTKVVD